jgi:hypothetical protein
MGKRLSSRVGVALLVASVGVLVTGVGQADPPRPPLGIPSVSIKPVRGYVGGAIAFDVAVENTMHSPSLQAKVIAASGPWVEEKRVDVPALGTVHVGLIDRKGWDGLAVCTPHDVIVSVMTADSSVPSQMSTYQITPTCELRAQVNSTGDGVGDRVADWENNHMFVSGVTPVEAPTCSKALRLNVGVANQSKTVGKSLVVELVFPDGKTARSAPFDLPAATPNANGYRTIQMSDVEVGTRTGVQVKLLDPNGKNPNLLYDTGYSVSVSPLCALGIKQRI